MNKIKEIHPQLAEAIIDVVAELSTELDLNYEDCDIVATGPTLVKLNTLVRMLVDCGYSAPEPYLHIINRYRRGLN
jgi:hypothetical protein